MANKSLLKTYEKDLEDLIHKGTELLSSLGADDKDLLKFRNQYEIWYSEAKSVIAQLLPQRLDDFELYYYDKKGDCIKKAINYTPPRGAGIDVDFGVSPPKQVDFAKTMFSNQLAILESVQKQFSSRLFDIKQLVQCEIFDDEIEVAKELSDKGFLRSSGVILGVVLEKHLSEVCKTHKVTVRKKNPSIADFNDALKSASVIDTSVWRRIQLLGDIRNICGHNKKDEPTSDDIEDMLNGTNKIIKSVF